MSIRDYTYEELEEEIKRRDIEEEKPTQLKEIDLTRLKKICQDYVDSFTDSSIRTKDIEHYIFETALETVFGKNVWNYVNNI